MDVHVHSLLPHFHPVWTNRNHLFGLLCAALVMVLATLPAPYRALARPAVTPESAPTTEHREAKSLKVDSRIRSKQTHNHGHKTRRLAKRRSGTINQQRLDENDDVPFMQSSSARVPNSALLGARVLSDELETLQIVNALSYVLALTLGAARLLRFHRIYPCRGRSALVIFASRKRQRIIEAICLILIIPLAVREVGNFMLRQMRHPPQSVSHVRTGAIADRTPHADLIISNICSALPNVPSMEYLPH